MSGARCVIADTDELNKINVFPVPDGDTGSNLAFTLNGILNEGLARPQRGVGELLQAVGDAAVDAARGNSGAILAQFFTGIAEAVAGRATLSLSELIAAIKAGSDSARLALNEPREGTMLSIMAAFVFGLQSEPVRRGSAYQQICAAWADGLAHAQQALQLTPQQLPALAKAGVVDAGALGVVDFFTGVGVFIEQGKNAALAMDHAPQPIPEFDHGHGEDDDSHPEHRYCTECLVLGTDLDRAGLRAAVAALGASCVVVAGGAQRVRVHAHVARPGEFFALASGFGRVDACKADDMVAQARSAASHGQIVVLTDSAADLPESEAERLNIHTVAVRVGFAEQDFLDKVGLTTAEFYRLLRQSAALPRTSQPPPGDFRRHFEFLLSHHPEVIYVGLARAVSGTLQSAETAAQRCAGARIAVLDSKNASGGEALLAMAAAESAQRGATREQIIEQFETLRPLTHTWAIARDVGHAVRGGRLPAWAQPVVEFLGITPIAKVSPEGKLSMAGALFGRKAGPERFASYVMRRLDKTQAWRLIVGHCDARNDGERLLAALREQLKLAGSWLVETGPAIGAHAGPGALLISLQPQLSDKDQRIMRP